MANDRNTELLNIIQTSSNVVKDTMTDIQKEYDRIETAMNNNISINNYLLNNVSKSIQQNYSDIRNYLDDLRRTTKINTEDYLRYISRLDRLVESIGHVCSSIENVAESLEKNEQIDIKKALKEFISMSEGLYDDYKNVMNDIIKKIQVPEKKEPEYHEDLTTKKEFYNDQEKYLESLLNKTEVQPQVELPVEPQVEQTTYHKTLQELVNSTEINKLRVNLGDTIELVAQKLSKSKEKGIIAYAIFNDIRISNEKSGDVQEIIADYYEKFNEQALNESKKEFEINQDSIEAEILEPATIMYIADDGTKFEKEEDRDLHNQELKEGKFFSKLQKGIWFKSIAGREIFDDFYKKGYIEPQQEEEMLEDEEIPLEEELDQSNEVIKIQKIDDEEEFDLSYMQEENGLLVEPIIVDENYYDGSIKLNKDGNSYDGAKVLFSKKIESKQRLIDSQIEFEENHAKVKNNIYIDLLLEEKKRLEKIKQKELNRQIGIIPIREKLIKKINERLRKNDENSKGIINLGFSTILKFAQKKLVLQQKSAVHNKYVDKIITPQKDFYKKLKERISDIRRQEEEEFYSEVEPFLENVKTK